MPSNDALIRLLDALRSSRSSSAILCDHANESPRHRPCSCPPDCYCKVEGSCQPERAVIDRHMPRPSGRVVVPSLDEVQADPEPLDWFTREAQKGYPKGSRVRREDTPAGTVITVWPESEPVQNTTPNGLAVPMDGWVLQSINAGPERASFCYVAKKRPRKILVVLRFSPAAGDATEESFWSKLAGDDEFG